MKHLPPLAAEEPPEHSSNDVCKGGTKRCCYKGRPQHDFCQARDFSKLFCSRAALPSPCSPASPGAESHSRMVHWRCAPGPEALQDQLSGLSCTIGKILSRDWRGGSDFGESKHGVIGTAVSTAPVSSLLPSPGCATTCHSWGQCRQCW